jgi:hypothetical protein
MHARSTEFNMSMADIIERITPNSPNTITEPTWGATARRRRRLRGSSTVPPSPRRRESRDPSLVGFAIDLACGLLVPVNDPTRRVMGVNCE